MGRLAYTIRGDFDWEYKFPFSKQCSNFGEVVEKVKSPYVGVSRYIGSDGEFVEIYADRRKLLDRLESFSLDKCPVCGTPECAEATEEMIRLFAEAVKGCDLKEIRLTLFVEYG
jgi:hypothetical protein